MMLIIVVGMFIPSACFLLGYCVGQYYERKGWTDWLRLR